MATIETHHEYDTFDSSLLCFQANTFPVAAWSAIFTKHHRASMRAEDYGSG